MSKSVPATYTIAQLDPHDSETVAGVYRAAWAGDMAAPSSIRARLEWLYCANPAGRAEILVLRAPDESPVGMLALVPRRFWVGGTTQTLGMLCNFIVHRDHRTLLPALQLQRAARELARARGWGTYAIPNERSLPLIRRLGEQTVALRPRLARVIRHREYLLRHSATLGALASWPLDTAVWAWDCTLTMFAAGLCAEWGTAFGHEFDNLWDRVRPHACMGERSAQFLTWRFRDEPDRTNRVLSIVQRRTGQLVSYAVGTIAADAFEIRDFLHAADQRSLRAAIGLTMRQLRDLGIAKVSFRLAADLPTTSAFRMLGFRPREAESVFIHGVNAHRLASAQITRADEDV